MPYLGNTPEQQAFTPAVEYFSGNGSTTVFTLSRPVASVAQVQVTVENVPQNPGTAYTVSGNTITFDGAPPSGTNNIYVYYTSPITQVIQPGQGTVGTAQLQSGVLTPTAISDQLNASTGYFDVPIGTTAQRPASPGLGMIRYNTTNSEYEVYNGSAWVALTTQTAGSYSVQYLVIAGGGGGGAGGGGAGGYRSSVPGESSGGGGRAESPLLVSPGTIYTVTVGAGGAGGAGANSINNTAGQDSVFGSITSTGGGRGGQYDSNGGSGGSGGGGGGQTGAGGSGAGGQGYAGGAVTFSDGSSGGGGAGALGQSSPGVGTAGAGGAGVSSSITGSAVTRGGGGGGRASNPGAGGAGGGGGGAVGTATAGTANTGGGGGGSATSGGSGAGGSGIVIIRYPGAQRGTGGTVTSSGGFTIHTFTTSGTYTA